MLVYGISHAIVRSMSDLGSERTRAESVGSFYRLNADGAIMRDKGQAAGEAAIGAILKNSDGAILGELSERIGWVKNHHVAEYRALIAGLTQARDRGIRHIRVFLDSALVVYTVNGDWKLKPIHLKPLCMEARALVRQFADIRICWVPREWNTEADALASRALRR
jgi:ribonuclease H / adenosylcobalamin/alpha-ribazole phosphatase